MWSSRVGERRSLQPVRRYKAHSQRLQTLGQQGKKSCRVAGRRRRRYVVKMRTLARRAGATRHASGSDRKRPARKK